MCGFMGSIEVTVWLEELEEDVAECVLNLLNRSSFSVI